MRSIQKPIVIVGAGFAGMTFALSLKNLNPSLPVIVVDSESNFIFKPLMYEVLSKEISMWEAAPKFANIFSDAGITFLKNNLINLYKLKSFLKKAPNNSSRKNLFVVGAGPSGIELACKISDLFSQQFEINIVEKSNEVLAKNKIFNREEAEKALERRKINVLLNSIVKEISDNKIIISSEFGVNNLDQDIVIWTAGIKTNLHYLDDNILLKNGRILVNDKLQIESNTNCFAIGDVSIIKGEEDLPVTAQVAMQHGNHLAKNIELLIQGKDLLPFEFKDNGEMISLGIGEASISALGITLSGKLAFEARRLIYASKLPDIGESLKSATSWIFQKKSLVNNLFQKYNKKD